MVSACDVIIKRPQNARCIALQLSSMAIGIRCCQGTVIKGCIVAL